MKDTEICAPVKNAKPRTLKRSGLALSPLDRPKAELFELLEDPACRVARLRPVASAYESWRGALTLSSRYHARALAWPVVTAMRPGLAIGRDVGLDRWEAEQALEGLLSGEARYVDLAAHVLRGNTGFILELPEAVMGIVVAADEFDRTVEIGKPSHLTEASVLA
jgi:hypothetical protein